MNCAPLPTLRTTNFALIPNDLFIPNKVRTNKKSVLTDENTVKDGYHSAVPPCFRENSALSEVPTYLRQLTYAPRR